MLIRHIVLHNFWLKLISLGLGSLIWLGVHYQIQSDYALNQPRTSRPVTKQRLTVPISLIAPPGDGRVFKISHREAVIDVVGEDAVLRKLTAKNLLIYVDLTDFHSRQPTNEMLRAHAPPDVIVSDIQPTTIIVDQISP